MSVEDKGTAWEHIEEGLSKVRACKHQKDTFYAGNIPCEKCRVEKLEQQLADCQAENKQLKNDHADMVKRNAALRDRPDIPTERVKAVQLFVNEIVELKAEIKKLKEPSFDLHGYLLERD